jgi:acetyl esterase/lipase
MRPKSSHVAGAVVLSLLVITPVTARAAHATERTITPITVTDPAPISEVASTTGRYAADPADTITTYAPVADGRYPAVIFIHGGAWGRAQPNSYELTFAADLAKQEQWVVTVVGYPTKIKREQIVEPNALAAAITTISRRRDVDPTAIALWGESAGGQLALLAAYRNATTLRPLIAGVVSISGPTDMRTEYSSLAQTALGAVTRFEGLTPHAARLAKSARYRDTSPVYLVQPNDPATFQAISRHDPLVPPAQVTRLTRLLAAAHVTHRTVHVPGSGHSTPLETEHPAGSDLDVEQLAVSFLEEVFAGRDLTFTGLGGQDFGPSVPAPS